MNKKKTYIAPAILLTTVCPDLNILAGSGSGSVEPGTGNCQFGSLGDTNDNESSGENFNSKINIKDVWE